ncbi:unnamed protein product [Cuscuta epithymum]|uniref:CCHC-type domain-containing protein n=1 Tax=Cuscuta epithymum TaxID=186058 RepID=A0AAV0F5L9_9ASTE|nr:unnamed protein product [Cuscuta epithymum]
MERRRGMGGSDRAVRGNPRGRAPGIAGQANRGISRSRKRRGMGNQGPRTRATMADHNVTEFESWNSDDDSTYHPESESDETSFQENSGEDIQCIPPEHVSEMYRWYQRERGRQRQGSQEGHVRGETSLMRGQGAHRAQVRTVRDSDGEGPFFKISKYLKEARALGCKPFDGTGDISEAAEWIKRLNDAADDMQVVPERKLRVATRLLEGLASTWWEGTKGKFDGVVTWDNFEQAFYEQFYTSFEVNRKRREYIDLKQGNEFTVKQLEQRFRHLARFLPEYAANENRMANHFWNALNLEIRERATYQFNMTFSEVVAQGLQGEELWKERQARDAKEAQERDQAIVHPPRREGKYELQSKGNSNKSVPFFSESQDLVNQSSSTRGTGAPKCENCRRRHYGRCREPSRCYFCGETGHIKVLCPQRTREGTSGARGGVTGVENPTRVASNMVPSTSQWRTRS